MAKKSNYTQGQKKAYYSGMGYRAGQYDKRIPFKNEENLKSFRNGYTAAKNAVDRYPKRRSK